MVTVEIFSNQKWSSVKPWLGSMRLAPIWAGLGLSQFLQVSGLDSNLGCWAGLRQKKKKKKKKKGQIYAYDFLEQADLDGIR